MKQKNSVRKNNPNQIELNVAPSGPQREQLARALIAAGARGITTLEAIEILGIIRPSARIGDLRKKGFIIDRFWTVAEDKYGLTHRIARFVYMGHAVAT